MSDRGPSTSFDRPRGRRLGLAAAGVLALAACGQQHEDQASPDDQVSLVQSAVGATSCKPGYRLVCDNSGCPPSCGKPLCTCELVAEFAHAAVPPPYQVVQITYAPPGNKSEVDYSQGSYTGSRTDYQTTTSAGIDAQSGVVVDVENKFKYEWITGHGSGVQTTQTTGISLIANMVDDPAPHHQDMFWVWTNPQINMTHHLDTNTYSFLLTSNGTPDVEEVTAAELLGEEEIPSWKVLSTLTADQRQEILNMDPFFSGLDLASTRYQKVKTLDLLGPDHPGDDFVGNWYDVNSDMSTDATSGFAVDDELTVDFHLDFIFTTLKAGFDFEYQYQKITTTTSGTQTEARIFLGTSNACVHVGFDVYLDKSFNTFFTVPLATIADGSAASGYNCCNAPHSLCEQGVPLDGSCQADACQATVCSGDPYCCQNWWDGWCVSEATSWCSPSACN